MDEQAANSECQEQQKKNDVAGVGANLVDDVNLAGCQGEHQHHDDEVKSFVQGRFLSYGWAPSFFG